jgi:hypothetical protein
VRGYREVCLADLELFDAMEPALEKSAEAHRSVAYGLLTLRYGRLLREAEVRWCDETIEQLEGLEQGHSAQSTPRRAGGNR